MDIKSTTSPVLPAGDVRGPAAKDELSRGTQHASFSDAAQSSEPTAQPQPAALDPGAVRLAQDPWVGVTSDTRLVLPANAATPQGIEDMALPDAVRSAVDFVFADLS